MSSNTVEAIDARNFADAPSRAAGLVTENVSAWFGDHKVLQRVSLSLIHI